MSNTSSSPDESSRGLLGPLEGALVAIRRSFIYFIWSIGILFLVLGAVIQEGVWAALFGIFGASALVYGVLGHLGLKIIGYK